LKSLTFVFELFRRVGGDETILGATKPFCAFGAELWKPRNGIKPPDNNGGQRRQSKPGVRQMHAVSLILAFALVLAGSSMAGSEQSGLPGIGTFAYGGAPAAIVVAAR
jgi:hypothetical protein